MLRPAPPSPTPFSSLPLSRFERLNRPPPQLWSQTRVFLYDAVGGTVQIAFQKHLRGHIGVEREFLLMNGTQKPVPRSLEFLERIQTNAWTYELSACQVEHRTPPLSDMHDIADALAHGERHGQAIARLMHCRLKSVEVGPEDMPLDIFPDERYKKISQLFSHEVHVAACRCMGTHIHIGVSSIEEAVELANVLAREVRHLIAIGDGSRGKRLALYETVVPNWHPPIYDNVAHFMETMRENNWLDNIRSCWHMVRISRHGTVEVRTFGATPDIDQILYWISEVRRIASTI